MPRDPVRMTSDSPTEYLLSLFVHRGKRITVLLVLAYVTGTSGVVLALFGNPADPRTVYGVAGVVLMGVSFCCLFVLSVTMVNLTGGG